MSGKNQKHQEYESIQANTPSDFSVIGVLFTEYQIELGKDLSFQSFDWELQNLSQLYNESGGTLLLLKDLPDDKFVGCIGLKRMDTQNCEMKRL